MAAKVVKAKRFDLDGEGPQKDDLDMPKATEPRIVQFKISGKSPLLQNNPSSFISDENPDEITAGKPKYEKNQEAELRAYTDDEGRFVHPAEAFRNSLIRAMVGKRFGKVAAASIVQGSVFVVEPWIAILDAKGKPATSYKVDSRSVVIKATKGRVLRHRPYFEPWSMILPLEIDVAIISVDAICTGLNYAGRIVGIGDFRPEKKGMFGRFVAIVMK